MRLYIAVYSFFCVYFLSVWGQDVPLSGRLVKYFSMARICMIFCLSGVKIMGACGLVSCSDGVQNSSHDREAWVT